MLGKHGRMPSQANSPAKMNMAALPMFLGLVPRELGRMIDGSSVLGVERDMRTVHDGRTEVEVGKGWCLQRVTTTDVMAGMHDVSLPESVRGTGAGSCAISEISKNH